MCAIHGPKLSLLRSPQTKGSINRGKKDTRHLQYFDVYVLSFLALFRLLWSLVASEFGQRSSDGSGYCLRVETPGDFVDTMRSISPQYPTDCAT